MPGPLPLILLPGMGADERFLAAQRAAFSSLVVPRWIVPQRKETLAAYARRLAGTIGSRGPCFVGGVSFGGMAALEMARHLDVRACFLISSIRSPAELPRRYRVLRPLAWVVPDWCGRLPVVAVRCGLAIGRRWLGPLRLGLLEQLADCEGRFLLWAAKAIVRWEPSGDPPQIPVFQIHGDRDRVLPCRLTRPDRIVPGAGHAMAATHPQAVNAFLAEKMAEVLDRP